jgi:hypothetical protein
MPSLRQSAIEPHPGMSLAHLDEFLAFLAARLAADDYREAESILWAAISPAHAAQRQRNK